MQEVYDITETALREFLNRYYIILDVPVGSYCAAHMAFTTDNLHPLHFCVFDVSDTPEIPTISCDVLYEDDKKAYFDGIKSPVYANDYEVWHVVPDCQPIPENTHYVVYGYIAERPLSAGESDFVDLSVVVDLMSARTAIELAYSIYNSPCYRVVVEQQEDIYCHDNHFLETYDCTFGKEMLRLDSERRLYGRYSQRVHSALSQLRRAEA